MACLSAEDDAQSAILDHRRLAHATLRMAGPARDRQCDGCGKRSWRRAERFGRSSNDFRACGNVYDAHAHSEYDMNGGQTVFVTYSRATGAFTSEVRLVAVRLAR